MGQAERRKRFGIRLYKEYFNFAAAHFLIFADGRREELHGHNYLATLELDAALDAGGLVADFLQVKPIFRSLCDNLDHRVLLPRHNRFLDVQHDEREAIARFKEDRWVFPLRDVRILAIENTASELLARYLCLGFLERLQSELPEVTVDRILVSVQESPGQCAIYEETLG